MLKKYIIKREHLSMLLFICHLGGGGGGGGGRGQVYNFFKVQVHGLFDSACYSTTF